MCQILGWGGWILLNVFIAYNYAPDYYLNPESKKTAFFIGQGIDFITFVGLTHILRLLLKRVNWLRFSLDRVVVMFVFGVLLTGIACYYVSNILAVKLNGSTSEYDKNERLAKAVSLEKELKVENTDYYLKGKLYANDSLNYSIVNKIKKTTSWSRNQNGKWIYDDKGLGFRMIFICCLLIALWLLIYIVWHYFIKNRNDQYDRLRLESTVKELELKTIKSHINPHFIFNSLNSIRALVDENPQRARQAVTELSNILRSSMHAEKSETVSLERELNIVKDYLALEHMRFEERLRIIMQIDEDTLQHPVPPMMLQTLVENAIKHGISKQVRGGEVKVISQFRGDHLELVVQNTGQLNGIVNGEGFGIKSTEDRLNLMYQGKAHFAIKNLNNNMVESKVVMPARI